MRLVRESAWARLFETEFARGLGKFVAVELSAENWWQLLVPAGFAHGFVSLEPDTEVLYKVNAPYAPEHDRGVAFDDPAIGIDWGFAPEALILSDGLCDGGALRFGIPR